MTELIAKEVAFKDGIPDGSSFHSARSAPAIAYLSKDENRHWHSGQPRDKGGPDPPPYFLWYRFKIPISYPVKISFMPRHPNFKNAKVQTPKSFQFVGTNDDNCSCTSDWSILCDGFYGTLPKSSEDIRSCEVKKSAVKTSGQYEYRCLGIKILAVHSGDYASLRSLKMWSLQ